MKLILFCFFLFANIHNICFSQKLDIIDEVKYKGVYEVSKPKGYHQAESEKFVLLVGDTYTSFIGETKMKYDSIRKKTSNIEILMSVVPTGSNSGSLSKEIVLVSRTDNMVTVLDKPAFKGMFYSEKITSKWILYDQFKTINGLKCQKATIDYCGRSYEVWFTKEIPLSVGPYKFFGLPGLVVSVQDTNCLFHFELSSFEKIGYFKTINFSTDGAVKATKKELQNVYVNFLSNPQFTFEAAGVTMTAQDGSNMSDKFKPQPPPIFIEILD